MGVGGGHLYVSYSFFITSPISFPPLSLALPLSVRSQFDLNDWSSTPSSLGDTHRHVACPLPLALSQSPSQLFLFLASLPPYLKHTHTHTTFHPSSLLAGLSSLQKLQGNKGIIDSILTETRRSSVGVCCLHVWGAGVSPLHACSFVLLPSISLSFCSLLQLLHLAISIQ